MELPVTLQSKIVNFLTSLPNIHDHNTRQALIQSAGLDAQLQRKIHFSGPSEQFFQLLIPILRSYGKLADGRDPLEAVLDAARTYVGSDRQAGYDQLIEALKAFSETRQHIQRSNPYRGLFAFREEDERFFFGRETYTQKVLDAVQNTPLVAVIGASGSGKSSLVYAGLISALRRQGNWLITSFRPGNNPFQAVAKALIPFLYTDELDRLSQTKKLAAQLQSAEISLPDVVARIIEKEGQATQFLLFADQFEELYTLCQHDVDRRRFLDELLGAQNSVCNIILTLRADFLGKALAYRPFADALQGASIGLGPMNRDELRETIEEPAKALDVQIEDGLTDRILDAVGSEPGNLPLLEFALTELWDTQANGNLTHTAYEALGGVKQALASYAEGVYTTLTADEQTRAQRIFTQLVRPGEGTEDTRRVATRADVGEQNWNLVAKLADARLVVTSTPLAQAAHRAAASNPLVEQIPSWEGPGVGSQTVARQDTVEVVHEALIQRWQRLQNWMDADREFRMWQERLRAVIPQNTETYTKDELLRGTMLTTAADWLRTRQHDLGHTEQQFIEHSVRANTRAQRRRIILLATLFTAIIAVAVALFGLWRNATNAQKRAEDAAVALQQETEKVKHERDQKEAERNKALKTQSLFLIDLARQQNERSSFTQAILLALEALPEDMNNPDRLYIPGAEVQLYKAVTNQQESFILQGHEAAVLHAVFSPDGTRIVTASWDGTARVWAVESGQELAVLRGHEGRVEYAAFSPDGTRIVTASWDGTARVWEVESGQELVVLRGHEDSVVHAAFSPDGTRIVTASDDGTARVWAIKSGQELMVLRGHGDSVVLTAFSPNGTYIVTASWDGMARVWAVESGQTLAVLGGLESDTREYASFSPDGTRIVTASSDNAARVWEVENGRELMELWGHESTVEHAAFSPDGTRIVTASVDGTARVWAVESGRELAVLRGHGDSVVHAEFSPDGTRIVTASDDATARVWAVKSGQELAVLRGHGDNVVHAEFSPDGTRIVTASDDGTARVWRAFPTTQALIDYARATLPRQELTKAEKRQFFLAD